MNPDEGEDEPTDFAFTFYDQTHPLLAADADFLAMWRERVAPYIGHRVALIVNGFRVLANGEHKRIYIRRVSDGPITGYEDVFGPGSLYGRAIRVLVALGSDDEIVVRSVSLAVVDDDVEDAESIDEPYTGDDDGEE